VQLKKSMTPSEVGDLPACSLAPQPSMLEDECNKLLCPIPCVYLCLCLRNNEVVPNKERAPELDASMFPDVSIDCNANGPPLLYVPVMQRVPHSNELALNALRPSSSSSRQQSPLSSSARLGSSFQPVLPQQLGSARS
jgi:hypothetical protein